MNTYTKLRFHLERHMYKKGSFKGDAPADSSRRGKTHYRVVKGNDDTYRVRMHGTDLITAYPDGTVKITTGGWWDSPTTILRLNEAFGFMEEASVAMYKHRIFSHSQPVIRVNGKRYRFYDGITLAANGEILTPLKPFEQRRIDKAETKELAEDLANSGFKDAFKLLYAVSTPEEIEQDNYALFGMNILHVLTDSTHADKWKLLIARNKFERNYWGQRQWSEKSNAKNCWDTLMAACKKNMFVVSDSDTYVL